MRSVILRRCRLSVVLMGDCMKRIRFGLDMDGVIYDWHSAARFLWNSHFDLNLPPVKDIWTKWDGHLNYVTKEQDAWLWKEGIEKGLFRHGHIRKGAIEFCQELDKIADIVLITHRPHNARQDTLDWIAYNKIPTSEIHMLHKGESKANIPVHMALDDKPETIEAFWSKSILAILWDRPWNQYWPVFVYRCHKWEDVLSWAIARDKAVYDEKIAGVLSV